MAICGNARYSCRLIAVRSIIMVLNLLLTIDYSTLDNIWSFVKEQLSKSKAIRVIFSRADGVKINEYREHLNYAMQKFEVRPSVKLSRIFLADCTCY